jgi:hypothetical protein
MDETVHLGQPQAGALADFLGGVERVEDPLQVGGGDAMAVVGHGDGDLAIGGFDGEGDGAPLHGIAGIDHQVDQGGFELVEVRLDVAGLRGALHQHLHVRTDDAAQHFGDLFDLMQHREHFRAQCLATGEGQQLAGELGGAVGGVEDGVQVTLLALRGQRLAAHQLSGVADHRQQVVEIVGHPPVSRPMASSFCIWRICASAACRSRSRLHLYFQCFVEGCAVAARRHGGRARPPQRHTSAAGRRSLGRGRVGRAP